MLTRFDHAVIAVGNLAAAVGTARDVLGLDAVMGGRHTGLGTHNGIIRFGLDYLELLGIYDQDEAERAGPWRSALLDFLARQRDGLLGYCVATDRIEELAEHFRRTGLEATGPIPMQRQRPDGHVLQWRLLLPGGTGWRRPWPFVIQWGLPDSERLTLETPGRHLLGATAVTGVAIAVADLEAAKDLYRRQLGLPFEGEEVVPDLAARRARFRLPGCAIDLLAPTGGGAVQAELDEVGEGLFAVLLRVQDLATARSFLARRGAPPEAMDGLGGWLAPPDRALGARLVLA